MLPFFFVLVSWNLKFCCWVAFIYPLLSGYCKYIIPLSTIYSSYKLKFVVCFCPGTNYGLSYSRYKLKLAFSNKCLRCKKSKWPSQMLFSFCECLIYDCIMLECTITNSMYKSLPSPLMEATKQVDFNRFTGIDQLIN